uniref:Uncharacterized protein At4g28440-like n=1 Tax=Nicotiana tabacum TaxID=4097 RepID=A0A1S4B4G1_TOBAC|nr:PREDICTED: uncharacterized protein At4g28440-like [Nicotiana tabacum]
MATAAAPSTAATTEKKKPVFVKVDSLKPGTHGHNLTVKVVQSNTVKATGGANRGGRSSASLNPRGPARLAECLVGDDTGSILFTARNEQGMYKIISHFRKWNFALY